jgi:TPR repeat protein
VNAVSAAGKVRLVILDACRDNPFAGLPGWARAGRSVASDRGLSRERDLPPNVVVLLATQAGARASDGVGTLNSPFAMALAGALEQDGLQLAALPSVISNGMKQASGLDQRPDQQGIFDSPFWTFRQSRDVSQTAIGQSFVRAPAEGDDEQVAMQVHDCDQATVDAGILRGGEGMITISATRRGDPQTRERKAISVCKKALAQAPGNGRLMNNIARLYGRINDDKQARYWYDEGVRVNDAETMTSVGKFLMDGTDGYTRDSVLGITMLERAARQGSALAMIALGDIYHDGKGTRQDPAEAFRWYELGAALSDSWAMFRTGEMALIGLGHSLDYALATKWLEKAQLASDWWTSATSMYYLGQIHELGLGVPKDLAQARHLYEQAIARGDLADAKARLAKLPQ